MRLLYNTGSLLGHSKSITCFSSPLSSKIQLLIDLRTKKQPLPLCEVQNFTIKQMEYKQVQ